MATDRPNTFGSLLRGYRTAAGFTQEEIAERARISVRAISDLERGVRTKPWPQTIALLADALSLANEDRRRLEGAVIRARKSIMPPIFEQSGWPAAATPLYGRDWEETVIADLLCRPDLRLLTLTGPGGSGKTRLALQVAGTIAATYPDGVRFVPLSPLRDVRHVIPAIAGALELQDTPDMPTSQTVENFLRRRRLLLLLDNFEHLIDAAPVVAGLLASCPTVTILVTSREPLHVQHEQELQVVPLATPPAGGSVVTAKDLALYPASALFVARAYAVRPTHPPDDNDAAAVAAICRHLDGLPLAIELAAAQVKYESPRQLLGRLQRRFEVLVGGPRDMPDRQQTMRACIAWSYDLLSPEEQATLCRMAVFAGGCTVAAIENVTRRAGLPRIDVVSTVHSLVDKSLLVGDRADGERARFTMLETIREYLLERLREQGAIDDIAAMSAHYYLELAEKMDGDVFGPNEAGRIRELAAERDNLRQVLTWSLNHDVGLGLRIGGSVSIYRFCIIDGRYKEWRRWIEQALASDGEAPSKVRAKAWLAAGWLAIHEGDIAGAAHRYQTCLDLARLLDDQPLIRNALSGLGLADLGRGDVRMARARFLEGIDIGRRIGAAPLLGHLLYGLGLTYQVEDDYRRAREHLEHAAKVLREQGDRISIGSVLRALGGIALVQGEQISGMTWYQDGLRAAVLIRHREGMASSLEGIAAALALQGQLGRAAWLWGAAELLHDQLHARDEADDAVRFASLPHLSPHLRRITDAVAQPEWQSARAEGHAARLEEVIADALRVE